MSYKVRDGFAVAHFQPVKEHMLSLRENMSSLCNWGKY